MYIEKNFLFHLILIFFLFKITSFERILREFFLLSGLKLSPVGPRALRAGLSPHPALLLTFKKSTNLKKAGRVFTCKVMGDELLDFFDLTKPFQRVVIAGGQSRGKIK